LGAGWATRILPGGTPSVEATSLPVNAEFTYTTSHVDAALPYFRPCMERVRAVVHSG
jgi:hypothetical protein